jgi:DNA-binding transcriptional ArsR family regulator
MTTGKPVVDAITSLRFPDYWIIPRNWHRVLTTSTGAPDYLAMLVLADIVSWYRASFEHDERTGETVAARSKFAADMLQRSVTDLAEQFGVSERHMRNTLVSLNEKGLIRREYRDLKVRTPDGGFRALSSVHFLEPVPDALVALSKGVPPGTVLPGTRNCTSATPRNCTSAHIQINQNTERKEAIAGAIEPERADETDSTYEEEGAQAVVAAAETAEIPTSEVLTMEQALLKVQSLSNVRDENVYLTSLFASMFARPGDDFTQWIGRVGKLRGMAARVTTTPPSAAIVQGLFMLSARAEFAPEGSDRHRASLPKRVLDYLTKALNERINKTTERQTAVEMSNAKSRDLLRRLEHA